MRTASITTLLVVLVLGSILLAIAAVQRRKHASPSAAQPGPALGSPAQVWLERGEKVARRLRMLVANNPALTVVGGDVDEVLAELRRVAADVAALDAARPRLSVSELRAERLRLDEAIERAAGTPSEADLRTARGAVDTRLDLAAGHRAGTDALLARMHTAVAGLEQAEDELTALLAASSGAGVAVETATRKLADRLTGLRDGLAEVRTISADTGIPDQGHPGDLPGSVEGPRPT